MADFLNDDDILELKGVCAHMASMYPVGEGVNVDAEGTAETIGFGDANEDRGAAFANREMLVLERLDYGGWRASYASCSDVNSVGTPYFYGPTVASVLAQIARHEY